MSTIEDLVSMTATDTEATVAGSSVALTEAEEDAASFTDPDAPKKRCVLTKESSVKDIKIAVDDDDDDDAKERDEEYAAPMHLHALRNPARLRGSVASVRSRSSSRSRPGSRRSSISPPRKVAGGGELIIEGISLSPSHSVESSLDGNADHATPSSSLGGDSFDPDILLDKLGMRDLDPDVTKEELQELLRKHIKSSGSLPTLNERMSEETMDDTHAFQDLQYVKKTGSKEESDVGNVSSDKIVSNMRELLRKGDLSNSAIMGSMSYLLNTLDEGEEEGDEDDAILNKGGKKLTSKMSTVSGDDEEAEVDVPTSIMKELELSDDKRQLKHLETSMATAPSGKNFLGEDEPDGFEANLNEDDVPR